MADPGFAVPSRSQAWALSTSLCQSGSVHLPCIAHGGESREEQHKTPFVFKEHRWQFRTPVHPGHSCPQVIKGQSPSVDIAISPHCVLFKENGICCWYLNSWEITHTFFWDFWFLLKSQADLSTRVDVHSCKAKISILSPVHQFETHTHRHTFHWPSFSARQHRHLMV